MKITSILLGTAAALSFVSGALAADAIVAAAPEPMDYVKVCDAFGTGYFYIPGTETCLKISGKVRWDLTAQTGNNSFGSDMKGRLEVNSANDTEYGKAYSFLRLDLNYESSSTAKIDGGFYAGIGGFEFGKFDNQWAKFFGYGIATDDGGDYGFRGDQYVSYTADLGSAKAYISLENDLGLTDYAPDVSGGISADFGAGSGAFGVGYDSSNSTYALKGVVRGKLTDAVEVGLMGMYASGANNAYNAHNGWGVIGGISVAANDKISLAATAQYFQDAGAKVIGNVTWNVAPGFMTFVEVGHTFDSKVTTGKLRIERSF